MNLVMLHVAVVAPVALPESAVTGLYPLTVGQGETLLVRLGLNL